MIMHSFSTDREGESVRVESVELRGFWVLNSCGKGG